MVDSLALGTASRHFQPMKHTLYCDDKRCTKSILLLLWFITSGQQKCLHTRKCTPSAASLQHLHACRMAYATSLRHKPAPSDGGTDSRAASLCGRGLFPGTFGEKLFKCSLLCG